MSINFSLIQHLYINPYIVHNLTRIALISIMIDWVDGLVIAIIFIAICILDSTAMATEMEKESDNDL